MTEPHEPALALLAPAEAPTLARSSPHLATFGEFAERFGTSAERLELIHRLETVLDDLNATGIATPCMLVGGGFIRSAAQPRDLDALVVYRLAEHGDIEGASGLLKRGTIGLDLRYVPCDVGPIPLVRMTCFFHTLYQSRDRHGDQASVLVVLER